MIRKDTATMTSMDPARFRWRKSSFSGGSGNECVELAVLPAVTAIRDSKNPDGGMLLMGEPQWRAFHAAVQADEIDPS